MTNLTTSLNQIKQFGIYLAKVDFPDKPGVYKVRPVLVLDKYELIIVALKMTSNTDNMFRSYRLIDWREEGLEFATSVILDPILKLDIENIFTDKLLGMISELDLQNIIDRL